MNDKSQALWQITTTIILKTGLEMSRQELTWCMVIHIHSSSSHSHSFLFRRYRDLFISVPAVVPQNSRASPLLHYHFLLHSFSLSFPTVFNHSVCNVYNKLENKKFPKDFSSNSQALPSPLLRGYLGSGGKKEQKSHVHGRAHLSWAGSQDSVSAVQRTYADPAHPQQFKVIFWSAGGDPKYTVV